MIRITALIRIRTTPYTADRVRNSNAKITIQLTMRTILIYKTKNILGHFVSSGSRALKSTMQKKTEEYQHAEEPRAITGQFDKGAFLASIGR